MRLRAQRPVIGDEPDEFDATADRDHTDVDLADLLSEHARFGIGLRVPDCRLSWDLGDDGYLSTLWLLAPDSVGERARQYRPPSRSTQALRRSDQRLHLVARRWPSTPRTVRRHRHPHGPVGVARCSGTARSPTRLTPVLATRSPARCCAVD